MSDESVVTTPATLRARPHPAFWLFVLFLVGFGAAGFRAMREPHQRGGPASLPLSISSAMLPLVFAVPIAVWLLAHEIVADQKGIRWRTWRGWRQVSWSSVTDYYLFSPSCQVGLSTFRLLLDEGQSLGFGSDWHRYRALCDFVRVQAGATETGEWDWFETRLRDMPRAFSYDTKRLARHRTFSLGATILLASGLSIVGVLAFLQSYHEQKTAEAVILFVLTLGAAALFSAIFIQTELKPNALARGRIGESWTVYPEGFVFRDLTGEERSISWERIIGYDFNGQAARENRNALRTLACSVRTDDGRVFTFHPLMTGSSLLKTIIRRRAVNGVEARIEQNTRDALGGVRMRWTGGEEGKGDRVFHAWTRTNVFTVLFLPVIMLFLPAGQFGARLLFHLSASEQPVLLLPMLLPSVLLLSVSAFVLWRLRIEVGRDELHCAGPLGKTTIHWDEIQEVKCNTEGRLFIQTLNGKILGLSTRSYAYGSELQPLIEERVRVVRGQSRTDAL